jgi:hypothetical protein
MSGYHSSKQFREQTWYGSGNGPLIQIFESIGGPRNQAPDGLPEDSPIQFATAQGGIQPPAQLLKVFQEGVSTSFHTVDESGKLLTELDQEGGYASLGQFHRLLPLLQDRLRGVMLMDKRNSGGGGSYPFGNDFPPCFPAGDLQQAVA